MLSLICRISILKGDLEVEEGPFEKRKGASGGATMKGSRG
jgi:hypothetical protein